MIGIKPEFGEKSIHESCFAPGGFFSSHRRISSFYITYRKQLASWGGNHSTLGFSCLKISSRWTNLPG